MRTLKAIIITWLGIEQIIEEKIAAVIAKSERRKRLDEFKKRSSKRKIG